MAVEPDKQTSRDRVAQELRLIRRQLLIRNGIQAVGVIAFIVVAIFALRALNAPPPESPQEVPPPAEMPQ